MSFTTLLFLSVIWLIAACDLDDKTEQTKNLVTKEHAALLGAWQEQDSLETITWDFGQYEVKWKGFSHFYRVSGDSLIISGLVYHILDQSNDTMNLIKQNGKPCTLVRKD